MSNFIPVPQHEDQAAFDRLLESYTSEFKPNSAHQQFLVTQLATSRWRLDRARRLEAHALDQIIDPTQIDETNPSARIVAHLGHNALAILDRWAAAAERSYFRAHRELTQARVGELRNQANEAEVWLKQQVEAVRTPAPDPWILNGQAPVHNEPKSAPAPSGKRLSRSERKRQRALRMAA